LEVGNRILLELSKADREAVLAAAEHVPIEVGTVLQEPMQPAKHAYFPTDGLGSIVALMSDGSMVEAASVGRDGFLGWSLVLGGPTPSSTRVIWQVPGGAHRLPADAFRRLLNENRFGGRLLTFIQQAADQMTQVAACNRRHVILQRAARWLLMVADRVDGPTFMLTQEFLATMLGVGRPKVSLAAQKLQDAGLISYRRGRITIHDRAGLERLACECYGVLAAAYPGR
jgi:CRP-like cAMP-binding protein